MSILESIGGFFKSVPIVGDLIGAAAQQRANRENRLMQERFASNGIRWRVEDAKAAGLHPLSALGAVGASASPSAQPLFSGQSLARSMTASATEGERRLLEAQIEATKAAAAKDNVQAAAAASEEARLQQQWEASKAVSMSKDFKIQGPEAHPDALRSRVASVSPAGVGRGKEFGAVEFQPSKITSGASWAAPQATAGVDPGWQTYQISPHMHMVAPKSDEGWAESLGEMPFWQIPGWITANQERFGPKWPIQFLIWSLGGDPRSAMSHPVPRKPSRWYGRGQAQFRK